MNGREERGRDAGTEGRTNRGREGRTDGERAKEMERGKGRYGGKGPDYV